ncbi:MAG: ADP-heptose--LPS heptosyltransferase 2 [Syntrophorhabdus sp. PtaU1.Bin058]|nr:MAG: ADP-heptose--LPS heptosyltransferase 2 [Syntrophorhabdus sp. PtaU1.Bin058]
MTGRTIVYLPNWLGDMVMAVPFLHALRAYIYGEVWAVGKSSAIHIYNGLNLFDRFITIDDKGVIPFLDTVGILKKVKFKRGIVLPHSFRSALLFYTLLLRERIGYARNKRGFMLNRKIQEGNDIESTVEHYLRIIDAIGGKRTLDAPVVLVTEDEEQKFDKKFTDIVRPYAVFITGAQYGPSKCWPAHYFSGLADMIVRQYGMKVYLLPGKGEEEIAGTVLAGVIEKNRVEVKQMNVRELKVCISRASFVVSNDTGPRHLSAALSRPTIVLSGPMDDRYTLYPSSCTYPLWKDVPCRPCNKKHCDREHECLVRITPEEVFAKVEEIVEKKTG